MMEGRNQWCRLPFVTICIALWMDCPQVQKEQVHWNQAGNPQISRLLRPESDVEDRSVIDLPDGKSWAN